MAEHTPGPWRQVEYDDWLYIGGSEINFIEYNSVDEPYNYHVENAVCIVEHVENLTEEGIANARLIATSPDLLAACKAFVEVHTQIVEGLDNQTMTVTEAMMKLFFIAEGTKGIIAKARSE